VARYKTLKGESEGEYREKGSRFLAYATFIADEAEAKQYIKKIAKEHFKAKHVCFAYTVGTANSLSRWSDANEPANTAGPPILNQIKKNDLHHVLIVVVRYFGGVLLGKGGLIRAYSSVANVAILKADIIEKDEVTTMILDIDINEYPFLMDVLKKFNVTDIQYEFGTKCTISFTYRSEDKNQLESALKTFESLMYK